MKRVLYIVLVTLLCSCSKTESGHYSDIVPEGYMKLVFTSDILSEPLTVKSVLDGRSLNWSGDEEVYIWYKNADGKAAKVLAEFDSVNGTSASLSVLIPQDAGQDEFYAEINGVNDSSASYVPWGDKGPRVNVNSEQTAVAGSFDPAALALGAFWKKGDSDKPHFTFCNLHNLLRITIDNQSGKMIDAITLSSSSSMTCKNYWGFKEDGSVKLTYSTAGVNEIKLLGAIGSGKASYYMVVPVKNNNGSKFKLDDMHLTIHCQTGEYFEAHNDIPLEIDINTISSIGGFTITKSNLNYPYGAPFGTYWGTSFMKAWNTSGFLTSQKYTGLATDDTRESVTAEATAMASTSISYSVSGNERMNGKYSFEFTAAESGKGTLAFWSKAGSTSHTSSILKNSIEVKKVTYTSNSKAIYTSCDIEVQAGDIISIVYNNTSSNASLFCGGDYTDSSGEILDRRIHWDYAEVDSGSFTSPEDLISNNQPFFNEI